MGRPTWAEIDLDRVAGNVVAARAIAGPDVRVMAVVKADAYGHGAVQVAGAALAAGSAELAVATIDEGLELRRAGITAPILVLGPIAPGEIAAALGESLTLTVSDPGFLRRIVVEAARGNFGPASIHVKLDSGMRRFGATEDDFVAMVEGSSRVPGVRLTGISTHLADADDPASTFPSEQVSAFRRAIDRCRVPVGTVHVANSAGMIRALDIPVGMVRLGIALYGLAPAIQHPLPTGFAPVMSIRSTVSRIIPLAPGDTVGYGRTHRAAARGRAALVPIGYADGFPRDLSSIGQMAIAGVRVPVLGRVSMDQSVVGLPDNFVVTGGTIVDVIGTGERGEPTFADVAADLGTISYDLVTGIARRVPRYYLSQGRVVGFRTLAGDDVLPRVPSEV